MSKKKNILKEPEVLDTILNSIPVRVITPEKVWCLEFNNKNGINSVNFAILDLYYDFDGDETSFIHIIPTLKAINVVFDYFKEQKIIDTTENFSFDTFNKYIETTNVEDMGDFSIYHYKINDKEFSFSFRFYVDNNIEEENSLLLFIELIKGVII